MAFCSNCGGQLNDNQAVCLSCGVAVKQMNQKVVVDDGNIGWGILGFFVPIVGLVLYLIWKDEQPNNSLMAGKGALISLCVTVGGYILFFIFYIFLFSAAFAGTGF